MHGVLDSQDYDCILFGAPRMVRNLTITGGKANLEIINLKKVLEKLEISREQLVDIAILVGTDFNMGVKGIGAKTGLKLIKEHGNIFNVIEKLDIQLEVEPEILRNIFLKHDVVSDYQSEMEISRILMVLLHSYVVNTIFQSPGF